MPLFFFFFNDTATTEIYTLSLHDALPISDASGAVARRAYNEQEQVAHVETARRQDIIRRSEEHTSELQSPDHLVCRLLLEKKKDNTQLDFYFPSYTLTITNNTHTPRATVL